MREHLETTIAGALDRIGVRRDALILLALSGGADSVALLHALAALRERFGYRLAAAHFNHHLRGDESDRDQDFVCDLCARAQIELVVGHAEDLGGCNLEERARELRYRFLHSAADRIGASHIALAHHSDDQAETVLIRLLRGTGVAGLGAMAEASGRLVRPMLSLGRGEIIDYLNAIGARFVTDSTNRSPAILRNRLRAELIPMLERDYAPQFGRRLGELADEMRSLDDFVSAAAEAELDRSPGAGGALSIDIARFATLHPALAAVVIRALVRRQTGTLRRLTRAHVEAMRRLCLDGPPNGTINLPSGWRAERQYGRLRLRNSAAPEPAEFLIPIESDGTTIAPGLVFEGSVIGVSEAAMPATPFEAVFDTGQIRCGLAARSFVPGDRIHPLGMAGTRKVKDVFIDHKVPRLRRAALPIVVAGDEVVWIPGLIRGAAALVTDRTTTVVRLVARPLSVA
ncbi:MAG: tRNA lysidine(34) synthetase TilS [Candidatus Binatales bacterium]